MQNNDDLVFTQYTDAGVRLDIIGTIQVGTV